MDHVISRDDEVHYGLQLKDVADPSRVLLAEVDYKDDTDADTDTGAITVGAVADPDDCGGDGEGAAAASGGVPASADASNTR